MNTVIELILADGTRELVRSVPFADPGELSVAVREALQSSLGRPEVRGAVARHDGGGEVRVARIRPPEKAETGVD